MVKTTPIINNNLAATPTLSSSPEDSKNSSLLKKVSYLISYFIIISLFHNRLILMNLNFYCGLNVIFVNNNL